jgi:hypothetical protein
MPPTPKTPRVKHRARVMVKDSKGQIVNAFWSQKPNGEVEIDGGGYSAGKIYLHLPVRMSVGPTENFTISVEYLGEKKYKTSYAARAKALAKAEKYREERDKEMKRLQLERDEKELLQRRKRIVNQIELAFVKKDGAVDFITCDECDASATHLGLTHENPGSQIIDPDQITAAWCEQHGDPKNSAYVRVRFKTTASIACSRLEFFYDGLRQIYVKDAAA